MSGYVVWFTGLSAAGKTTIAGGVAAELEARGVVVDSLDGDVVRTRLSHGLGFSKEDRDTNIARIAWVASRIARAGGAVLVSAISPYSEARRRAREQVTQHAPFVEIYVATPLAECIRRDPKRLYERALAGEIGEMTGVSSPYEAPTAADLTLDTTDVAPADSIAAVVACLEELDLVPRSAVRRLVR